MVTLPSISRALKTARGAVFAPRDADAGPGLFDSRTPQLLTMYNKKKKAQPLAKLSFLVTLPSISRALKTARGAVFAPRDADAGPGLFDSRTPQLLTMYNKKKKAQPLAKLSFLVTRTGIEPMLQP